MLELASIIILGIAAQYIAWRTRVPAILPLILIGLIVGPISTFFTHNGEKWIEPIYNTATGHGLFPGNSLFYFVSLAIGIILFEGGLTLKRKELEGVGPAIIRLITLGSLVTFILGGFAAHYIIGMPYQVSFLFAGLIIVTGPTVIAPILRNVPLKRNVAAVLKWEGILIDPIGALVAVLVFEFIVSGEGGGQFTAHALGAFLKIVAIGFSFGYFAAHGLNQLIKREMVPHYLLNVFTLALVLFIFVLSDTLIHESGLLTVVVMGVILGNLDVPELKEILYFKESLSVLLISILFILLSANISLEQLNLINNWQSYLLFATVVFAIRPIGVFLSTRNSELSFNEKLFISWVGPRGIVAAGIASLFGIRLVQKSVEGGDMLTPLVFMIVMGTVLLNATTARVVARLLGVTMDKSDGILFIGANDIGRIIAKYLQANKRRVVLVDNSQTNINKAKAEGLEAIQSNIYQDDLSQEFDLLDVGYLIAVTGNNEVNKFACKKFASDFGENGTFRLMTPTEMKQNRADILDNQLFSWSDDYINYSEALRDYPQVNEVEVQSIEDFTSKLEAVSQQRRSIPIFIKNNEGLLNMIPGTLDKLNIEAGNKLVYIGQVLKF